MPSIIATAATIILLALLGMYSGAYRRAISLIAGVIRSSYNLTETKVHEYEKKDKMTSEMKEVFPEIKEMRKSTENSQKISSISYVGICLIVISLLVLFLNFEWTTGQMVTKWLSHIFWLADADNITIYLTSVLFSMLTSGMSMVLSQWKKAYKYRRQQSLKKVREAAKENLTEEELLEIVSEKVAEKKKAYEK